MTTPEPQALEKQLQEYAPTEGVFSRSHVEDHQQAPAEDLTNRLLAKIAGLEAKLYERELADAELIRSWNPAVPGRESISIPHSQAVNQALLSSLGDPERQQGKAADSNKREWLALVPNWLSKTSIARSALESIAGQDSGAAAVIKSDISRSTGTSAAQPCNADWLAVAAPEDSNTTGDVGHHHLPLRGVAQADSLAPAGKSSLLSSLTLAGSQALPDVDLSSSHSSRPAAWKSTLKQYYRYYLPADDAGDADADDDDADRVQEAAGIALAEANERLKEAEMKLQAAQAAQKQLEQQVEAAGQLSAEIEQLKNENLEAWKVKYALESQMAAYKASLDGMQRQGSGMKKELEDMRKQAQIWSNANSSEIDKMRAEASLLNSQLADRNAELSSLRQQLTEAEAARDRALQEKHQAEADHHKLVQQMQQLTAVQQQLTAAMAEAAAASAAAADWEEKFLKERAVRRRLHEQLQVLRGNIRVMCRVRPPLTTSPRKSSSSGSGNCISFPLEGLLSVRDAASARQREFEFDAVFAPEATQQQVFEEVSPLVRSCADGYNACIFAYGQTGSGKTYTMDGPADNPGINTRALQELFDIASDEIDNSWSFTVAMLEIYNEAVHDLLAIAAAGGTAGGANCTAHNMEVSGLPAGELPCNMDRVPGLLWHKVSNLQEVQSVLREGARARATAATALNVASSRSHALVCVKVQGVREGKNFMSMLHLVDLAGSERVDKSEVAGQQLKEAQAINKSLSALGDVIAALQRRGAHIPFRNSKLTQVLQDSLCGSSKVLLVCNLSPETASCSETLSSLNFASRAAQVELGQARRVTAHGSSTNGATTDGGSLTAETSSTALSSSPEPGQKRNSGSSSLAAASGTSRLDRPPSGSGDRGGSPSPSKTGAGSAAGSVRSSITGGSTMYSPSRSGARVSDKPPSGPPSTISPRVSGVVGRPARH